MKGRCNNKSKRRKVSRKASKWQKLSEKLESMLTAVILSSLMLISTKSQSKTSLELLLATKSINRKNQCNLSKKKPGNNKVYWIIYREKMISIQKVFYISSSETSITAWCHNWKERNQLRNYLKFFSNMRKILIVTLVTLRVQTFNFCVLVTISPQIRMSKIAKNHGDMSLIEIPR